MQINTTTQSRQRIFPLASVFRPAWGPSSLLYNGYRVSFPGGKRGRSVTLTNHPHLVPGMNRSCLSSPPWRLLGDSETALLLLLMKSRRNVRFARAFDASVPRLVSSLLHPVQCFLESVASSHRLTCRAFQSTQECKAVYAPANRNFVCKNSKPKGENLKWQMGCCAANCFWLYMDAGVRV
jgi:hypothetical protein